MNAICKRLIHFWNHDIVFRDPESPRILVVQIAGIGDTILATPALDALREKYPNATIDLVTSPASVPIITGHRSIDNVFLFDIQKFSSPQKPGFLKHLPLLFQQILLLRKCRYDVLVSLNKIASEKGSILLGLLFASTGIPCWIGRDTDLLAPFLDHSYRYNSMLPVPEPIRRLRTVSLLGANPAARPASLYFSREERKVAREYINADKPTIGIHPGSNRPARKWPAEKYRALTDKLVDQEFQVLIFGGPADKDETEMIAGSAADAISLSGKVSLRQSAVLMDELDLMVCNNSGPMHIAAAVKTPIVAVFDPVHRVRFAPWTPQSKSRLIYKEMKCSATDEGPCPQNPCCLHLIEVDEVFSEIVKLLASENEPPAVHTNKPHSNTI